MTSPIARRIAETIERRKLGYEPSRYEWTEIFGEIIDAELAGVRAASNLALESATWPDEESASIVAEQAAQLKVLP